MIAARGIPGPALLLITLIACDHADPGQLGQPALRVIAGADLTDTIGAAALQGLVVQLTGANGRGEAGVQIRFDVSAPSSLMRVSGVSQPTVWPVVAATTDANGRASALV